MSTIDGSSFIVYSYYSSYVHELKKYLRMALAISPAIFCFTNLEKRRYIFFFSVKCMHSQKIHIKTQKNR